MVFEGRLTGNLEKSRIRVYRMTPPVFGQGIIMRQVFNELSPGSVCISVEVIMISQAGYVKNSG